MRTASIIIILSAVAFIASAQYVPQSTPFKYGLNTDSIAARNFKIRFSKHDTSWAIFYKDSTVLYVNGMRKLLVSGTNVQLFNTEHPKDTLATRAYARGNGGGGGGGGFDTTQIIGLLKMNSTAWYRGTDSVYVGIDSATGALRFYKMIPDHYQNWYHGSFGYPVEKEPAPWRYGLVVGKDTGFFRFIWGPKADPVAVWLNAYVYLPPSTWPIGDFGRVGIYYQVETKNNGPWWNVGQFYRQNQSGDTIRSEFHGWLGMGSPSYGGWTFNPAYYGYSVNDTVLVRIKFEGYLGWLGGWVDAYYATGADSTWFVGAAPSPYNVKIDSGSVLTKKLYVDESINATDATAALGVTTAKSLQAPLVTVGDPVASTAGSINIIGNLGSISTLHTNASATHDFYLPGAIDTTAAGDTLATEKYVLAQISAPSAVRSYITQPGDKPPYAPHAWNDEFDTNSIDTTTHWHWWARGAKSHVTEANGMVTFSDTGAVSGNVFRMLYIAVGDSNWSITTKETGTMSGNYHNSGLIAYNATNDRLIVWGSNSNAFTAYWLQLNKYHTPFAGPGYDGGYSGPNPWGQLVNYFRIRKVSGTFYGDLSADGILWTNVWTEAGGTYLESSGKVNKIGFGVLASANTIVAQAAYWWFRVNWIADWNPLIDH